jgi:hypothetical protein
MKVSIEIHESDRSRRLNHSAQYPCVLANPTTAIEPILFEKFGGGAKQEATLCLASDSRFRNRLDKTTARVSDKVQRAFQGRAGNALVSVILVHKDASDAPLR